MLARRCRTAISLLAMQYDVHGSWPLLKALCTLYISPSPIPSPAPSSSPSSPGFAGAAVPVAIAPEASQLLHVLLLLICMSHTAARVTVLIRHVGCMCSHIGT